MFVKASLIKVRNNSQAWIRIVISKSLEVMGFSEDGMFFEFHHNFYNHQGKQLAHCQMMGGWMDLQTRRLTSLKPELLKMFANVVKGEGFRTLTKEDTRRYIIPRKDLA